MKVGVLGVWYEVLSRAKKSSMISVDHPLQEKKNHRHDTLTQIYP